MKKLHALVATVAVVTTGCEKHPNEEIAELFRAHRGMSAEQIEEKRPEFIDVSCVITPRPKMAEASAVFTYDYASSGDQHGLSPMTAEFEPDSSSGAGTIRFSADHWAPGTYADVDVGESHRITVSWTTAAAADDAEVIIQNIEDPHTPVDIVTEYLHKLRWSQLPLGLTVTYLQNSMPHVTAWPISANEQWLFVKIGPHWVKLVMKRV